jgi:hypothetical protein
LALIMGVQAASLANLRSRAAFEPSNKLARRYSDVDKAIRLLRHAAPDPVALCIKLFRDVNEPVELRAKVAVAIADKALPNHRVKQIGLGSRAKACL